MEQQGLSDVLGQLVVTVTAILQAAAEAMLVAIRDYPYPSLLVFLLLLYLGEDFWKRFTALLPDLLQQIFETFGQPLHTVAARFFQWSSDIARYYENYYGARITTDFLKVVIFSLIALGGAFVNFFLILGPLTEWFGSRVLITPLGNLRIDVSAALFLIALEFIVGIALLGAVRDVRNPERRNWLSLTFLGGSIALVLFFSVFEAYLAMEREALIELARKTAEDLRELNDNQTSTAPLADPTGVSTLPTIAQAGLGFVFPWLLAYASGFIERLLTGPLPTLILNVAGVVTFAFGWVFLRVASLFEMISAVLVALVDMLVRFVSLIFDPLRWLFRQIARAVES